MKNSLRIHKWTHNEFNIFILGVLTRPHYSHTYPHTLVPSHPYSSGKKASCLLRILWMGVRFNSQGANKAAVYLQCCDVAPLVQLCCPFGIPMLIRS